MAKVSNICTHRTAKRFFVPRGASRVGATLRDEGPNAFSSMRTRSAFFLALSGFFPRFRRDAISSPASLSPSDSGRYLAGRK